MFSARHSAMPRCAKSRHTPVRCCAAESAGRRGCALAWYVHGVVLIVRGRATAWGVGVGRGAARDRRPGLDGDGSERTEGKKIKNRRGIKRKRKVITSRYFP